jgi:Trypsin-co-occurring domain 1
VTEGMTRVPVVLPNGAKLQVEVARPFGSEMDVADVRELVDQEALEPIKRAIEGLAGWISSSVELLKPSKASVEFGIEIGTEAGQLTALLVKGHGKANLKITLEWSHSASNNG